MCVSIFACSSLGSPSAVDKKQLSRCPHTGSFPFTSSLPTGRRTQIAGSLMGQQLKLTRRVTQEHLLHCVRKAAKEQHLHRELPHGSPDVEMAPAPLSTPPSRTLGTSWRGREEVFARRGLRVAEEELHIGGAAVETSPLGGKENLR